MGSVTIGIDVGQMHERSAIAVVEAAARPHGERGPATNGNNHQGMYYTARYLERLPVGTPSPALAARLKEIVAGLRGRGLSCVVCADATGAGQPLIDVLVRGAGVPVTPVYTTWGDRRVVAEDETFITLGKAYLVSRLQALLQTGRLLLPASDEARVLAEELLSYELTMTKDANETYGAFVVGTRDELVTALGLAVQVDPAAAPVWHPGFGVRSPWTGAGDERPSSLPSSSSWRRVARQSRE